MILVDSSVLIDALRREDSPQSKVLSQGDFCVCGVTIAEVLHGARDEEDYLRIMDSLDGFLKVEIREEDWVQTGRNLHLLKKAGRMVPFQDVVLATLAVCHDLELWTNDKHFQQIRQVLGDLKLFVPE